MEIVLSIICIVLLVVVIYLLYTTQMKLHEKMVQTEANSSSLDRQYNSIITMLNDASTSLGRSDTKINQMINDMHDINVIMTNTKKRGTFGEYQLYHILSLYCGDNSHIFESQYHLSNGKIGDAALHLPGNTKVLIIDSKFPMENYLKIVDNPKDVSYHNEFKKNVKKVTISGTSKTLGKLAKGKTYYVKVIAYKKGKGAVKVFGKASKVKKVKIKK